MANTGVKFIKISRAAYDRASYAKQSNVFYAVYTDASLETLEAVYLGTIELSDLILRAYVDAKLAEINATEGILSKDLADEVKRATEAEAALASRLDTAEGRLNGHDTAIATNKSAIESEVGRATGKETELNTKIDTEIAALREELKEVANVMNFRGAFNSKPDLTDEDIRKEFHVGDVIMVVEGADAGKEFVCAMSGEAMVWVEIGYSDANAAAISALQGRMDTAEGRLNGHDTDVATLTAGLAGAVARIEANEANIAALDADLTAAEGRLDGHDTAISGLDTRLATAEGDIVSLKEKDAEHTGLITGLRTDLNNEITNRQNAVKAEAEAREAAIATAVAAIRGKAEEVKLDEIVLAINQLTDNASTVNDKINPIEKDLKTLDERMEAAETALTWETVTE